MTGLTSGRLLAAIERESSRFVALLAEADRSRRVPSCPDWDVAELSAHTGGILRWVAEIVRTGASDRIDKPGVPTDDVVVEWFREGAAELTRALADADPDPDLWNWAGADDSLAFWTRRMAHEVLVHRLDLELAVDVEHDPVEDDLAIDGIEELFEHFAVGVPAWGDFTPVGGAVSLVTATGGGVWHLQPGRCVGTTPGGREVDLAAMVAVDEAPADATSVMGGAADLHRWLWGRGDDGGLEITGDPAPAQRVRDTCADAT